MQRQLMFPSCGPSCGRQGPFHLPLWRRQLAGWLLLSCALSLSMAGCSRPVTAEPSENDKGVAVEPPSERKAGRRSGAELEGEEEAGDHPFPRRVDAPSLEGGAGWINTAAPLSLRGLRGKFVLLDFWTYCCINCLHVLPELKKLEHAYPNQLVVIGVHSAKFDTEKLSENIRQAVLRYEIEHPVVNDSEMLIWRRFGISGWPALRVIDPEGKLIAAHGGEIDFESLDRFFRMAIPFYKRKGLLDETPLEFELESHRQVPSPLRYPGKLLADAPTDRLYIADSGHHRIVVTDLAGKWIDTIGTGQAGREDGSYEEATFCHPQGLALLGQTLYVCDTQNHLIRKIDLATRQVRTVAGTGQQNRGIWPGMDQLDLRQPLDESKFPSRWASPPRKIPLGSPWAVHVHDGHLYIAMAGPHQIWRMSLDEKWIEVYAGNGREDIVDGRRVPAVPPRLDRSGFDSTYSSFAQPSGLASDGQWLFVADTEGSSIRAVPLDPRQAVETIIGTSELPGSRLFIFGDRDGKGLLQTAGAAFNFRARPADATEGPLLQHAIGIAYRDGQLYVADTYNNKIKQIDLKDRSCRTIAGTGEAGADDGEPTFDEPAGLSIAGKRLFVADTNNHLIRTVDLEGNFTVATLSMVGLAEPGRPRGESSADGDAAR
ncbi:MAG: redoxin domain-containing protein [Planctomycetales bacterium]|nr:redoxin domain-containing protein [Planctomycetales bacterium]NIM10005.1 redoxin domain-containing protein [Planctomycetales bacterium]NIN09445.1 redoxin domain-containing protein [Planctomycetales bacterium]NIN78554.1 redoxin domain-containing protein [Planctomycetales bacterium]NIO35746.1 redoxin domain-containing protein [Planctomycetales bacterium]